MHKVKSAPIASFKALDGEDGAADGSFEALVSVFGNVDYAGDRVVPGAFTNTLAKWAASGDPIPVIWSHKWDDPDMHIGSVTSARETPEGLVVIGALDLQAPVAAQVYRLLKGRRVKEFSFAYDIVGIRDAPDGAFELTELDIIEVGPTLRGMNPATELVDVKSSQMSKAAALAAAAEQAAAPAPDPEVPEPEAAPDASPADGDAPGPGTSAYRAPHELLTDIDLELADADLPELELERELCP